MIFDHCDIRPLQDAVERLKRLQQAEERMKPVDVMIKSAEATLLETLKEQSPKLVEPFKAIQALHDMHEDFLEGQDVRPDQVAYFMQKAQEFVMYSGRELQKQDPPTETE